MTHLERLKSWTAQAKDKLKMLRPGTAYYEEVAGNIKMYEETIQDIEARKKQPPK